MQKLILLFTAAILSIPSVFAQDTLIIYNNYKWKIGGKLISERSESQNSPTTIPVFSGGFQALYKLGSTKSSIESGVYLRSVATEYYALL